MTTVEMSPAHTPGPWEVDGDGRALNYFAVRTARGHVARTAISPYSNTHRAEGLANARLISAAPDLLEAAKKAQRLIDDMSRFIGGMALQDYAIFNEAPLELRAAILKAEGVSS